MNVKQRLWGVWALRASRSRTTDGKAIASVWGEAPEGLLVYTPSGRMTVMVLRTDRLRFAGDDARTGSIEEIRSCFEGFNAYYGSFTVDEDRGIVQHTVDRDLIPNFDGDTLTRYFALDGDTLTLTTTPYVLCGEESVSDLVWQKLESLG